MEEEQRERQSLQQHTHTFDLTITCDDDINSRLYGFQITGTQRSLTHTNTIILISTEKSCARKLAKTLRHQHNLISIIITYVSVKDAEIDETVM